MSMFPGWEYPVVLCLVDEVLSQTGRCPDGVAKYDLIFKENRYGSASPECDA
jgi:hypothetical protein